MTTVHRPFLIGRIAKNDRRIMVLTVLTSRAAAAPIRGPWDLRAVVAK